MNNLEKKYKEDLIYMIQKYEETFLAPYYSFSKQELKEYIQEYLSKNEISNDMEFLYFVKTIIKRLNGTLDTHTSIKHKNLFLPLFLKMFDDGIYVVKTDKENEDLLYSKLESINEIPYKNIINEIEDSSSYSTDGWKKSCIESSFSEMYSILCLPSINLEDNNINLLFKTQTGEEKILEFKENDKIEDVMIDKENCTFEIQDNTIHYIYNSCLNKDSEKLINSIKQIKQIISSRKIKNFILDLRDNFGGNSSVVKPLIDFISQQDLKYYTFINRNTYSAGVFALEDMLKLGSTTIGEEIGTSLNCFGDANNTGELPNTKYSLCISQKYFPKDGGMIKDKEEFREYTNKYGLTPFYYKPDVIIKENIQDYIEGRDIYMEKFKEIQKETIIERE